MSHQPDAIDDLMREVAALNPQLDPMTMRVLEARMRLLYGGRRVYIRKLKRQAATPEVAPTEPLITRLMMR